MPSSETGPPPVYSSGELVKVNPRQSSAALSLFLLFALDGTLRMAASPQTGAALSTLKLFQELRWRLIRAILVGGRGHWRVAGVRGQPEVFSISESVGGGIWKTN